MVKKKIVHYLNLNKCFGIEYCEPLTFDKKVNSNRDLPDTIESLNNYVEYCNLCELSKLTKKKTLGFGNRDSKIYIVATSCDFQNENILKLLKSIIENILELNIQDVYLTNLIKCDIPLQNNINNKHIALCKEYFIKQVDIIRPKFIIALGDVSSYLLKNENNVSYIYGNSYDYNGLNFIPMLDLEYVYKNPSYQDELYKDFKKFKILMGQK